jgi:hypothetical protein
MSRSLSSKRSFTVLRALALLPISVLAMVGCGTIIGLDNYTVAHGGSGGEVSVGGGGSPGGASSVGGRSGSSSTGGTAGTTATGAAGVTGEAGAGEAGAGSVAVPGAVGCDGETAITINDDVVRTCVLRGSCDPFFPVRSISQCVTNNTPDAFAGEHCHISSCADYQACEHNGIAGDDLCPQSKANTNYCAGNKAVSCGDPSEGDVSSWVDCIGLGGTGCGTYTDKNGVEADCTLAQSADVSCAGTTPGSYVCSGEATPLYQYQCTGGRAFGFKCGDFAYCSDSSGDVGCYLTSQSCDLTKCSTDGTIATACTSGKGYEYNCGSVGLTCLIGDANADGDSNYCLAPGCKPADVNSNCTEFCNGSKLDLCYGGAQVEVDCTNYGFAGCLDHQDNGDNLHDFAYCTD